MNLYGVADFIGLSSNNFINGELVITSAGDLITYVESEDRNYSVLVRFSSVEDDNLFSSSSSLVRYVNIDADWVIEMVYFGLGFSDGNPVLVGSVKKTPWVDADGEHHTAEENYSNGFSGFDKAFIIGMHTMCPIFEM